MLKAVLNFFPSPWIINTKLFKMFFFQSRPSHLFSDMIFKQKLQSAVEFFPTNLIFIGTKRAFREIITTGKLKKNIGKIVAKRRLYGWGSFKFLRA